MKMAFLDLDGTLLDSSKRHEVVLKEALFAHNVFQADVSQYLEYKSYGRNTFDYLTKVLGLSFNISKDIDSFWKLNIENEKFLKMDQWYDDAILFLENLKTNGYFIEIVTARQNKDYVIERIRKSKYSKLIDHISVVSPFCASDEKKRVFSKRMGDFNICVGDTETDYVVGKSNGVKTYMLNRGFRNKMFWDNKGITSYASLLEILDVIGE